MVTELKNVTWINDGRVDLGRIIANIETVRDAVDEVERLRVKLADNLAQMFPVSLSYVIEGRGEYTVLDKGVRSEMKLKQCFITAGADGDDTQIDVLKNGADILCEPITLKSTESRGKVVVGDVNSYVMISQFDEIIVSSNSDRRIVVSINFEK